MTRASPLFAATALLAAALPLRAQDRAAAVPDMRILLENACVRMQFHDVAVGASTPMHAHPRYAVYVFNAYRARITLADGSQRLSEHKAGDAFWHEASQHIVENIGDTPIHNLVVELKPEPKCSRAPEDPSTAPSGALHERKPRPSLAPSASPRSPASAARRTGGGTRG